ncbi:MAG: hypothetical protein COB30_006575 [Ectothiorhodospiraceae bacterium]|nr:hypothetical protein [Ectothiorhodospiraceae bacterium]
MNAIIEERLTTFSSVLSASIWAEGRLLRTGVGSHLRAFVAPGGYREIHNPMPKMSLEDSQDLAQTISCKVARIQPVEARDFYRYVIGNNDMKLAQQVSRDLAIRIKGRINAPRTPISKIESLALVVIIAERKWQRYGDKTSASKIAQRIGVSRSAMAVPPWGDAKKAALAVLKRWIDLAEHDLSPRLIEAGII